jgi:predicted RecB family nuclease
LLGFLLNARAASTCPRATHNRYDSTVEAVEWVVPDGLAARFTLGIDFERGLVDNRLTRLADKMRDLRGLDGSAAHVAATVEAMAEGVPVIVGGRLPDDFDGHRVGKPDVLIRSVDSPRGTPGYVPADIKAHRFVAAGKGPLQWSTWAMPTPEQARETDGARPSITARQSDVLQLAHYWRMLEACGWASERSPIGAIVGTDVVDGEASPLVWVDLDAPTLWTFSRSQGRKKRSPLERYDHELAFRASVAEVALQRVGSANDPEPLVRPIYTTECEGCRWHDYCLPLMDGDPSVEVGRLDRRSWQALRVAGVDSVDALAGLDPYCLEDPDCEPSPAVTAVLDRYLPEVSHLPSPRTQLAAAAHRARMIRHGIRLERRTSGPVELPSATVTVDFDIEWDTGNRVYLWGFLLTKGQGTSTYHPVVSWEQLDDDAEAALAAEAWHWLGRQVAAAQSGGGEVLVWHYARPEITHWRRMIERGGHPGLPALAEFDAFVAHRFEDLNHYVQSHLRGVDGLGLKNVAVDGPGFHWRDQDPGGLQSQAWHTEAVQTEDEAAAAVSRIRILEYNEDDVRATFAVREWLRGLQ